MIAGIDRLDLAACEVAVMQVIARYGRLDGVAHMVVGFAMAPLAEAGQTQWEQMSQGNPLSTLTLLRAAVAAMRPAGRG
ncbi:MAG: hypothetical protein ACOYOH_05075 [Paracraurococcus sp.]